MGALLSPRGICWDKIYPRRVSRGRGRSSVPRPRIPASPIKNNTSNLFPDSAHSPVSHRKKAQYQRYIMSKANPNNLIHPFLFTPPKLAAGGGGYTSQETGPSGLSQRAERTTASRRPRSQLQPGAQDPTRPQRTASRQQQHHVKRPS